MALGKVDYGLFGVVGALTIFISFLNSMLSGALGRYYAFAIGESMKGGTGDRNLQTKNTCNDWFNVALSIHTVVPILLMAIGYPVGIWAVENFLSIPPDRIEACIWVFRLACVASFVAMVNVPFTAMYAAKQYIAELTVYSFIQTTANTVFFYFMATHPGDWLVKYAIWMCVVSAVPQLVICIRAFKIFPECRFDLSKWWNRNRTKEIVRYTSWQMFGGLGALLRGQGIAIIVNRYFGPTMNASMSIANQVNSQTGNLSSAMMTAFTPAITTAYGMGDIGRVQRMTYRLCKFGMILLLVFMIPLALEIEEVMRLWLKSPPPYSGELCLCMMLMLLIDKSTIGHMVAVQATGKIGGYQMTLGGSLIVSFLLAWLFVGLGWGIYSMCLALILMTGVMALGRLFFARHLVGLSVRRWLLRVAVPVVATSFLATAVASISHLMCESSFARIVLTTMLCESVLVPLCWFFILNREERCYFLDKIKRVSR